MRVLKDYSTVMFTAYKRTGWMQGEVRWQDFISALRPYTLRGWTPPMIVECKALLIERGIRIDTNRNRLRIEPIIDLLYPRHHEPVIEVEKSMPIEKAKKGQDSTGRDGKRDASEVKKKQDRRSEKEEMKSSLTEQMSERADNRPAKT